MKLVAVLLSAFAFSFLLEAEEPAKAKKPRSSVPGPYPSIIKLTPSGDPGTGASAGIIQSELGGREMLFLQSASRAGAEQLVLAELAKKRGNADSITSVAAMLASTQVTENKEIARLAAEKHVPMGAASTAAWVDEMEALSGAKFEKAWIERLIAVSESGVAAYEIGAEAADPAVRSFAGKMLPIAQARLQMANRLDGRSVAAKPAPAAQGEAVPRSIPPPLAPSLPAKP